MKNSLYKNNLKLLNHKFPEIYRQIKQQESDNDYDISVINTKYGIPTLEIAYGKSKLPLHSKIDPLREINRIIESKLSGLEDTIVIIGFGMGYLAESIIDKMQDVAVLIFEPSTKIFKKALEIRNLTKLLSYHNLNIIIRSTNIDDSTFNARIPYRPIIISLNPYKRIFSNFTKDITDSYYRYMQKNNINTATLKKFDRLWTKNSFKNAYYFFKKSGVNVLRNFLKGKIGALVIAAGPSIEEDIELIKTIKSNIIIISVDTAFRPLIKYGIIPDFVISVDPQYINSLSLNPSFYMGIDPNKLPILVLDPAVYPTTLRNYPGKIILTSSVFPPGKIIESFSGFKGEIAAGGSVSVTAFDFARIIGASPIVLIGLDLSYILDNSHIKGSFIDFYRIIRSNRFNTLQSQFEKYLKNGSPIKTINNRGEVCYTDRRMTLYKSWFEKNIPNSKSKIINSTNRGIKLNNVKFLLLQDIEIRNIKKSILIKNMIVKLKQNRKSLDNISNFINYLEKIERNLKVMLELSKKAERIISEMTINKSYQKDNRKLENIESEIITFKKEIQLISMTMQNTVVKIMKGIEGENEKLVIDESEMLYNSIEESSNFLLKIIKNTIVKLKIYISTNPQI